MRVHQEQGTQQQQWNPCNATAASSNRSRSSTAQHDSDPAVAAAAAATAANSSGLSAYALRHRHSGRHQLTGLPAGPGGSVAAAALGSQPGQAAAAGAALRSVLLSQHEVALEQFGSLQEALEYLEQQDQQETLVGLAAEDYSTGHKQQKHQGRQRGQGGLYPGMYSPRNSC
jgi:hypothetical protein